MNAKHAGKIESYLDALGAKNRSQGQRPRHARAGRHAAMPVKHVAARMMRNRGPLDIYGWRLESLAHVARIAPNARLGV